MPIKLSVVIAVFISVLHASQYGGGGASDGIDRENVVSTGVVQHARVDEARQEQAVEAVARPLSSDVVIPEIARGHEEEYLRFINGRLIFIPDTSSVGRFIGFVDGRGTYAPRNPASILLQIRDLVDPLDGTFDLAFCGYFLAREDIAFRRYMGLRNENIMNIAEHLSISTGYPKARDTRSGSADKVEIWIAPRFLIERELETTAAHFQPIMGRWTNLASVGIFRKFGNWDLDEFDYVIAPFEFFSHGNWDPDVDYGINPFEFLPKNNLNTKLDGARRKRRNGDDYVSVSVMVVDEPPPPGPYVEVTDTRLNPNRGSIIGNQACRHFMFQM